MKRFVSVFLVWMMLFVMSACSLGDSGSKNITEKADYQDCNIEIVKCVPQISRFKQWLAVTFVDFENNSKEEMSFDDVAQVKVYQNGVEVTGSVTYVSTDHGIEHDTSDKVLPGGKITVADVTALSDLKTPLLVRVVDYSDKVLCEKEFEIASSESTSAEEDSSAEDTEPEVLKNWEKSFYVDDFDEPTEEWYVQSSFSGTFSNSATTDSKLTGYILIDQEDITFFLYEYGRNQVKNIYSRDEAYTIVARLSDETTKEFKGSIYSKGDRIIVENAESMKKLLLEEEKIKFYIYESDNSLTNYLFEVESGNLKDLI